MSNASTSLQDFQGRHVLVTGAANGIGRAVARQLLAHGATVSALDLDPAGLESLQRECDPAPPAGQPATPSAGRLWTARVDVSDAGQVDKAVAAAEAAQGPLDGLASVAGILEIGAVTELEEAQWARCLAVNATGVFHVCQSTARRLKPRGRGAIVVVSSNAATTPRAGMAAYAASKAAVTQFSRCLGLELAAHHIRVNVVSPGSTDTAMQHAMWARGSSLQAVIAGDAAQWRLGIPLGKIASPDEIAASVLFLLSDAASHITLHDLRVDGGATLDQG